VRNLTGGMVAMSTQENAYIPADMPRIDGHVHLRHWYNGQKEGFRDFKELLENYRVSHGFSAINIACIPYLHDRDVCHNMMAALLKLDYSHYYAHAGLVYPNQPIQLPFPAGFSPEEQLEDLIQIGFDGIKLLETQPNARKLLGIGLSDPCYEPFFARLEAEQISVIWHVGNPAFFWDPDAAEKGVNPNWCYCGTDMLGYEEIMSETFAVMDRHPNLRVIFAHLFFMGDQPQRLFNVMERYPNVCVDITPGVEMYPQMSENPRFWHDFFIRYADRIVLGTDSSTFCFGRSLPYIYRFLSTADEFCFSTGKTVHGLGLTMDVVEKILHQNFRNLVGKSPRPINREAFSAYVRKYQHLMLQPENRDAVLKDCAEKQLLSL